MELSTEVKPIISYYKHGDPSKELSWIPKLTDVNIIKTKVLSDEFIKFCVENKHRIYLHVVITGMGDTVFEQKIPRVKTTFLSIKKLISLGFPSNQILVIVDSLPQNDNGIKVLKLLLRVFTEFKELRLRNCRITLMRYKSIALNYDKGSEHIIKTSYKKDKTVVWNENITKRKEFKSLAHFVIQTDTFYKEYKDLLQTYENIIHVDDGVVEPLIGIRELTPFGLTNIWNGEKLITYEKGSRYRPIVNVISNKFEARCSNRCVLCLGKN